MQIVATRWSKRDSRARLLRWLRVGGHPRWPGRAGGVGGGKRPARGQRHGEQESSSASLTAELRVMVSAAPPLPGNCGERSSVCEGCIRRGKPAESSCSPQNLHLQPRASGWKPRRWLAYQGWYLGWHWICRFPAASLCAGGGWRWCGSNVKPLCAYSDTHLWCLRRTCRLGALFFPSVLLLPPLASRLSCVFCQQRWCRFVFRSASPPLC